jgi:hypothetical protein
MADFNKPDKSVSLWSNILSEIRSARESVAKMFDGGAGDTNIPTDAKRIDNSTGEVLNYNGSTWDSLGTIGVDVSARADVITAQATAETAQDDVDTLTAIVSAGNIRKIYHIDATATGDGSGSDASNRMTMASFQALKSGNYHDGDYDLFLYPSDYSADGALKFTSNNVRLLLRGNVTLGDLQTKFNGKLTIASSTSAYTLTVGTLTVSQCSLLTSLDATVSTEVTVDGVAFEETGEIVCAIVYIIENSTVNFRSTELTLTTAAPTTSLNINTQSSLHAEEITAERLAVTFFSNMSCGPLTTTTGDALYGSSIAYATTTGVPTADGTSTVIDY